MSVKRFHVRDGYVLDEHPTGSVVRYDHYAKEVEKLNDRIDELELAILQHIRAIELAHDIIAKGEA